MYRSLAYGGYDRIIFLALQVDRNIVTPDEGQRIESYVDKVHAIRDVLKRDHMKVAFFGRYTITTALSSVDVRTKRDVCIAGPATERVPLLMQCCATRFCLAA